MDELLTVAEAAQRMRVSPRTIHRWLHARLLPNAFAIPGRSRSVAEWRIPADDLEAIKMPSPVERIQADIRQCEGVRKDGAPCGQPAMGDSDYCRWHQPAGEE